jgi:hypothetical protein
LSHARPTSFAESLEKTKEIAGRSIEHVAEGSLAENVTPPALRSAGVTFSARLLCWNEVRIGKGKKSGWLSANDVGCLKFIGEQGTVTVNQIWRRNGGEDRDSLRHLYRRVEGLIETGVLKSFAEGKSHLRFLSLSRKGAELVHEMTGSPVPYPPPPRVELRHTVALTEFRLAATESGRVSRWLSDRVLKLSNDFPSRLGNYCPDAYWVTKSGKRIFLEYERTRKTKARRQEKFHCFSQEMGRADRYMDMVVWVADGASREMLEGIVRVTPNQKVLSTNGFLAELARKASS